MLDDATESVTGNLVLIFMKCLNIFHIFLVCVIHKIAVH